MLTLARRAWLVPALGVAAVIGAVLALAFITRPRVDLAMPAAAEITSNQNAAATAGNHNDSLPHVTVVYPRRSVDILDETGTSSSSESATTAAGEQDSPTVSAHPSGQAAPRPALAGATEDNAAEDGSQASALSGARVASPNLPAQGTGASTLSWSPRPHPSVSPSTRPWPTSSPTPSPTPSPSWTHSDDDHEGGQQSQPTPGR
jgi:hypothetical protein